MTTTYQATRMLTGIFKKNINRADNGITAYRSFLYDTDSFGNLHYKNIRQIVEDGRTDLLQAHGFMKVYERVKGNIAQLFGRTTAYQDTQMVLNNLTRAHMKRQSVETEIAAAATSSRYSNITLEARLSILQQKRGAIARSAIPYNDVLTAAMLEHVGYIHASQARATYTIDERFIPKTKTSTAWYAIISTNAVNAVVDKIINAFIPRYSLTKMAYATALFGLASIAVEKPDARAEPSGNDHSNINAIGSDLEIIPIRNLPIAENVLITNIVTNIDEPRPDLKKTDSTNEASLIASAYLQWSGHPDDPDFPRATTRRTTEAERLSDGIHTVDTNNGTYAIVVDGGILRGTASWKHTVKHPEASLHL